MPGADGARRASLQATVKAAAWLGLLAVLGLAPGASGRPAPLATLVWLAVLAIPSGAYCAMQARALTSAGLALAVMALVLAAAQWLGRSPLPNYWAGLGACAVLVGLGLALGSLLGGRTQTSLALATTLVGALLVLPSASSIQREPWPRALRAVVLDLSPATVAAEWAGVDWMRHPAVYDSSGTVDFDPGTRTAYRASLAGALVFVVGCAAAWFQGRASQRHSALSS